MRSLLNAIGSLFVYRSPEPLAGFKTFLRYQTCRELRPLAGTKSHYNKTILINMIMDEMNDRDQNS